MFAIEHKIYIIRRFVCYVGKLDGNQSRTCFIQIQSCADTQLSIAAQTERIQMFTGRNIDQSMASSASDLGDFAAHQIGNFAWQIFMSQLAVAQLTVHAGAEREHASILG